MTTDSSDAPKIYISCYSCWMDYLKDNLQFMNFVRVREEADIFLQILYDNTASDGRKYVLYFTGYNKYSGLLDTLGFSTDVTMSSDISRNILLKYVKIGLIRYLSKTPFIDKININVSSEIDNGIVKEKDLWDSWVISVSGQTYFNGQNTNRSLSLWGSVGASRLTDDLKLGISIGNSYNEDAFNYSNIKITSISKSYFADLLSIWSLDNHWSIGSWGSISHSSYSNKDLGLSLGPGIEYNLFPYSEYAHREFRLNYKIKSNYVDYHDTTIYDKMKEFYIVHQLSSTFELIKEWGNFSVSFSIDALVNDVRKNNMIVSTDIDFWLFRGFSVDLSLRYSYIHNQLNIAKGNATIDEVLLQRRQLETNYTYWGLIGFSYSFGSIYNNIVNTRFGN